MAGLGLNDKTKKPNAVQPTLVSIGLLTDPTAFVVQLDASIHEVHEKQSVISEYPLETGANVADHVRPKPNILKLRGIVSQTPEYASAPAVAPSDGRVSQARDTLIGFRNNGTMVEIATAKEHYTNMVIVSLVEAVDATNANDFEFDITAQQVLTAASAYVQAPVAKKPVAATNTKLGPKVPTADPSALQSGFNAIAAFISSPSVPQ